MAKLSLTVCLISLAIGSGTLMGQEMILELNRQEAGLCKLMRRSGSVQAAANLSLTGLSCDQLVLAGDQAADDLLEAILSIDTQQLGPSCYLAGAADTVTVMLDEAVSSCQDGLGDASKAGYQLGYSVCYLGATAESTILFDLTPGKPRNSSFDRERFVFIPSISKAWTDWQTKTTVQGIKVGCSSGIQDAALGKKPRFAVEGQTTAFAAGSEAGRTFARAFCGINKWDPSNASEMIPGENLEEFAAGFQDSWTKNCDK